MSSHINSIRPSIKVEKDGCLPFLDILITSNTDGSIGFSVYCKPTHTDRYTHFYLHHPTHVKRGLATCLFDRAKEVTTDQTALHTEHGNIPNSLSNTG